MMMMTVMMMVMTMTIVNDNEDSNDSSNSNKRSLETIDNYTEYDKITEALDVLNLHKFVYLKHYPQYPRILHQHH